MAGVRRPCTFRQRDVTAALKAARDAGISVARIEIDRSGRIVMEPGKPNGETPDNKKGGSEWDDE